jgi:hypothetical protein
MLAIAKIDAKKLVCYAVTNAHQPPMIMTKSPKQSRFMSLIRQTKKKSIKKVALM